MLSVTAATLAQAKLWMPERVSPELLAHCERVENTAAELAERFGLDPDKARLAAYLHDNSKELDGELQLEIAEQLGIEIDLVDKIQKEDLHARIGAFIVREQLGIDDSEVLAGIGFHTFGPAGIDEIVPNKAEQVSVRQGKIYLAVMVADDKEPNREAEMIAKIDKALSKGLEEGALKTLDLKIKKTVRKDQLLHPFLAYGRNYLLQAVEAKKND